MLWSGDRIIIRNFDLMKSEKKFDLMNLISWKNEFWPHEIRPPDPQSIYRVNQLKLWNSNKFQSFVWKSYGLEKYYLEWTYSCNVLHIDRQKFFLVLHCRYLCHGWIMLKKGIQFHSMFLQTENAIEITIHKTLRISS